MFERIEKLKKEIGAHRPLNEEVNRLLQERLRIEWTYNSNAIEGNTLTLGETAFFLREGLTSEGKPLKDYLEAQNHAEAIDSLHEIVKQKRPLSESFIKQLHSLLLKGIEFTYAKGTGGKLIRKPLAAGKYKTRPNHVLTISGKIHKYVEPIHVPDEMEKLLKWYDGAKSVHPVEKAAIFHYRFVAIHPFDDGNGRMARLLMNLILMRHGYFPCIIKNENRYKYLKSLEMADAFNDMSVFVSFIEGEVEATMQSILRILKSIDILKSSPMWDAEYEEGLNLEQRESMILKVMGKEPLSISQIQKKVPAIKRPTLKSDLKRLVKNGNIKVSGKGKGVLYCKGF